MKKDHLLILDIGTTRLKAFVFGPRLEIIAKKYLALAKDHPRKGWVEQDPEKIVKLSVRALRAVLNGGKLSAGRIAGFGLTNQRETTVLWDKTTGRPVYPAIVWEDRRTAAVCTRWRRRYGAEARRLTGLTIDPYFSASKIGWVLKNVPKARKLLSAGRLAFGTVDSWVLWNLCQGHPRVTDESNASRT